MTVVGSGTVFHAVRTCEHEVGILLALHIDGRTALVGDVRIVQVQLEVRAAVDGQRTVAGGSCHHVADALCRAVVHGDVIAVDGYAHPTDARVSRTGHIDIHGCRKRLCAGSVAILRIGGSHRAHRLCCCLVGSDGEGLHLAISTRGGLFCAGVVAIPTVVPTVVRGTCPHHHRGGEHRQIHYFFHFVIHFLVICFRCDKGSAKCEMRQIRSTNAPFFSVNRQISLFGYGYS